MNDTHDQFLKKVHEYFKLNQTWEAKQTHVAGMQVRKLLSEIRHLASARREEIQAVRAEKPKTKSPKYRQSLLKDQKDTDTN
jgi:hypothetical protein